MCSSAPRIQSDQVSLKRVYKKFSLFSISVLQSCWMSAYYRKYKIKSIDLWDDSLNVRVGPEKDRSRKDVSVGPEKGGACSGCVAALPLGRPPCSGRMASMKITGPT
jgi:hypothetical protein